jgi:hypothetical protein
VGCEVVFFLGPLAQGFEKKAVNLRFEVCPLGFQRIDGLVWLLSLILGLGTLTAVVTKYGGRRSLSVACRTAFGFFFRGLPAVVAEPCSGNLFRLAIFAISHTANIKLFVL